MVILKVLGKLFGQNKHISINLAIQNDSIYTTNFCHEGQTKKKNLKKLKQEEFSI